MSIPWPSLSLSVTHLITAFYFLLDKVYIEEMPKDNIAKKWYTNVGYVQDNFASHTQELSTSPLLHHIHINLSSDGRVKNGN